MRGSQQGLFWNHLSKSPAGAVGTGSSPLGEPGHPLGHFSPVASASVLKHCGPARWLCQQDRAFTPRGRPLSRHQPGSADFVPKPGGRGPWAQCPAWPQSWAGDIAPSHRPQKAARVTEAHAARSVPIPPQDFNLPEVCTGPGSGWGDPLSSSKTDIFLYTEPAAPQLGGGRLRPKLPPQKPSSSGARAEVEKPGPCQPGCLVGWATCLPGASGLWGKPLSLFYWKINEFYHLLKIIHH